MQQKNDVEELCKDVLDFGDLLLIASKSHGKTESLKTIAKELKAMPNTRVFIFEDFPKFCHEFEALAYFVVKDSDVVESEHTIDIEDFFLRHERSYTIKRGSEIKEFLKENKHGIFTMEIRDIERSAFFIYSIVNHFYRKQYLKAKKYGTKSLKTKIVFIIEESQNVFDSSTISKKLFNRMRKIFSVARNLGIHFIMCSQRLQDLNTKIRSRTRLLIGRVSLDDYELKFSRLLRNSIYRKAVLSLPKGVFLFPSQDMLISFPRFKQDSKPYEWLPKPQPKPQPKKVSKLRIFLTSIGILSPKFEPNGKPYKFVEESEEEELSEVEDEEMEEDLGLLGEPDEEW